MIVRQAKKGNSIPTFFQDNKELFETSEDISEGFNNLFTNVGEKLANKIPETSKSIYNYLGPSNPSSFKFKTITEAECEMFLKN